MARVHITVVSLASTPQTIEEIGWGKEMTHCFVCHVSSEARKTCAIEMQYVLRFYLDSTFNPRQLANVFNGSGRLHEPPRAKRKYYAVGACDAHHANLLQLHVEMLESGDEILTREIVQRVRAGATTFRLMPKPVPVL